MRLAPLIIVLSASCATVQPLTFSDDFDSKFGKTISIQGLYLHQNATRSYLCPMSATEDVVGCILLAGKLQFDSETEIHNAKCVVATGQLDPPKPIRSELRIGLQGRMEPAKIVRCMGSN